MDAFDNIVFASYPSHSIHGPRNQRHGKTPSRFIAPAISAHPGQTARCFGHVARMDTSPDITRALKVSIRGLPKAWRRPPGRPRRTRLRTLEADLQPLNIGLNSAWKYTQDREHWKHLVETATLQLGAFVTMMMMTDTINHRKSTGSIIDELRIICQGSSYTHCCRASPLL